MSALPQLFSASISQTYMPQIAFGVAQEYQTLWLLDNSYSNTTIFGTSCTQYGDTPCSDPQASFECDYATTETLNTYVDQTAGGYTTNGWLSSGLIYNNDLNAAALQGINYVGNINANTWMYNVQQNNCGSFGLGPGSEWLNSLGNSTNTEMLVELGPVADQSFVGGTFTNYKTSIYAGSGDYSTLFNSTASHVVLQNVTESGQFPFNGLWFGQNSSASQQEFLELGYSESSTNATIALNFQGLGLPFYEWSELISLLYRINNQIAYDLTCMSEADGVCTLSKSCNDASYTDLWTYFIKVQWQLDGSYTTVNIGSFAIDTEFGTCDLYLELLRPAEDGSVAGTQHIVFGSMWLQNFVALFEYDYSTDITVNSLSLTVANTALPGASIDSVVSTQTDVSAFTSSPQNITILVDNYTMTARVEAELGFQGLSYFMLSLSGAVVQTYSSNCSTPGVGQSKCDEAPNFAKNYFVQEKGIPLEAANVTYDGYTTQGSYYNQSICIGADKPSQFCSLSNNLFFVADYIVTNDWNYYSPATAGIIGLASGSPVWKMFSTVEQSVYYYTIQFANVTDWNFAQTDYVTAVEGNSIAIGLGLGQIGSSQSRYSAISIKPTTSGGQLYGLDDFSFGKVNITTQEESYKSIINGDISLYGANTNTTLITTDFRGIGLPTTSYNIFANLLDVISQGQATCAKVQGGFCTLPHSCDNYPLLWTYSFRIQFTGQVDYLTAPLASFAATQEYGNNNYTVCAIYVEKLDESLANSLQIVLGQMFFQSFSYLQQFSPGSTTATIAVSPNALEATQIGTFTDFTQFDAFTITPENFELNKAKAVNGLPIAQASMFGYAEDFYPYFMLDFSNDRTVVWNTTCMQYVNAPESSCFDTPTFLVNYYSNVTNSTYNFTDKSFGGYLTSGTIYLDEIYVNNFSVSKVIEVYAANAVTQDAWLYGQQGAYGILGYGPNSPFWNQYIDPVTATATYMIALADPDTTTQSNITLGSANLTSYEIASSIVLSALTDTDLYEYMTIGFGLVYQSDKTSYFQNISTSTVNETNIQFSVNFQGMGLPSPIWLAWSELIANVSDASCNSTLTNQTCVLPNSCSSYSSLFDSYSFQIMFSSNTSDYIRVPLEAFAVDQLDNTCKINVIGLDTNLIQSSNVILGGLFFNEFVGVFKNMYTNTGFTNQTTQLFINAYTDMTTAYIGDEMLAQGVNPFLPVPYVWPAPMQLLAVPNAQYMVEVTASFANQTNQTYLINNNADYPLAWTTICEQSASVASDQANTKCSSAPSLVTESLDESLISGGGPYSATVQGGYTTSGQNLRNSLAIQTVGSDVNTTFVNMYAVEYISGNAWQQNVTSPSGQLAFGINSQYLNAYINSTTSKIQWSIEVGCLANRSYVGQDCAIPESKLYVGPGNYSLIYPDNNVNMTQTLEVTQDNNYNIAGLWFGIDGAMTALGYSGSSLECDIATNFQGLGLPFYEYNQFISLLSRTNGLVPADLTCDLTMGGRCQLNKTCDNYPGLFDYQITTRFNNATDTYITVPISTFTISETDSCQIYVQLLESDDVTLASNAVFGSMWLQNFVAYFEYDFSGANNTDQMTLQVSEFALKGASINNLTPIVATSAFSYLDLPMVFPIEVNSTTMTASISAQLGFQGVSQFLVSMTAKLIQTYTKDCKPVGLGGNKCQAYPNYATKYFNTTNAVQSEPANLTVDGYELQSNQVSQSVCLPSVQDNYLCSIGNEIFFVTDVLVSNDWNFASPAKSGIIGVAPGSPIWNLIDVNNTGIMSYSTQFSNTTDWSFAAPSYKPISTGNSLTLTAGADVTAPSGGINFKPTTYQTQLFTLTQFGFGTYNSTNLTESYSSVLNSNSSFYGINTNQTFITMDFRGIGLPTTSFYKFANLMDIASQGSAYCARVQGGICFLPKSCDNYPSLWDYSFRIMFAGDDQYMIVPIASFAATITRQNNTICEVFVELLDESKADSLQIVLGQMFFQSFNMFNKITGNTSNVTLTLNENALPSTYLGSQAITNSTTDPFVIVPTVAPLNVTDQSNGLPTFSASLTGMAADVTPYYLIDFAQDLTVVWDSSCIQTITEPNGPCADAPTFLQAGYSPTTTSRASFTDMEFGGYLCSGKIYLDQICVGTSCKWIYIYSATTVSQNAWLYDQQGAFGILGYGPNSYFWNQYVNAQGFATYSIELATVQALQMEQNQIMLDISNVTLGGSGNTDSYAGQPSLIISTGTSSNVTYGVSEFGFGLVYQINGVDNSSYFQNISSSESVLFTTNFQGLGLPTAMYAQYIELLANVTESTAVCVPDSDGVCILPNACSNYTSLLAYSFQIMFTSNTSQYIRVPLSTFAISTADNKCEIAVSQLSNQNAADQYVILGGMFFQQFFGVFENAYTQSTGMQQNQKAEIYIQYFNTYNSSYIGNEMLSLGANPFQQVPPTPPTPTPTPSNDKVSIVWVIILCVIIVLLSSFLGWAIYKWKQTSKETDDRRYVVYGTEGKSEPLASQTTFGAEEEL